VQSLGLEDPTMTKTAADVMQTAMVTVSPNDPLHTVQRLFFEEGIHGAPVVDEEGKLQGIITSTDILRAAAEAHEVPSPEPARTFDDPDFVHGAWGMAPEDFKERLQDTIVADFMTEHLVQVAPDTSVGQIARTLRENEVHRVLVVDRNRLCGIVSAFDLVALLEG
jgi:CBS domain-containing protein